MPVAIETLLTAFDYALMFCGALVVVVWLVRRRNADGRDPLRGSPLRPNRLTTVGVWLCFAAQLAGWTIGPQIATLLAPEGLAGDGLKAWQGVVGAGATQLLVVAVCLAVASHNFLGGLRGFGLGRCGLAGDLAVAVAGWLVAIFLCQSIYLLTEWAVHLVRPDFTFEPHSVFKTLEQPQVTPLMRWLAIGGALLLAPIGEELFFRGIVQTAAHKLSTPRPHSLAHRWIAIIFTGVLFGLMHFATPQHVPALIALGCLLGFLYERRGSLVTPIAVHLLFNGKSLLWYFLING